MSEQSPEAPPPEFHDAPPPVVEEEQELEWPVTFMIVFVLAVLYVGWRIVQMIGGLFG